MVAERPWGGGEEGGRLRASLCPVRAARLSAPPPGLPLLLDYRAAPPFYTLPTTSLGTRRPRPRGGRLPRACRAPPPGPLRAPPAAACRGREPRRGAGGGRRGGGSPAGGARRGGRGVPPPARSGTAGLGNPLTQISLYGIHPVRGGVTDGKRSRLQPSAAGGARGGTGRNGTERGAAAPRPHPHPTRGETPPTAPADRRCPRGRRPAAGDTLPLSGEGGSRRHPGSAGTPRSPAAEQGAPRETAKQGRGPGPIPGTERGLPIAGHGDAAGPTCGKPDQPPSLQRGTCYVALFTCLLYTQSNSRERGYWHRALGSPAAREAWGAVAPQEGWESLGAALGGAGTPAKGTGRGPPGNHRRGVRGEACPFLQFGFCFDPCCSEARRHPPTTGMSGSPGSGQAKLGARPQTRLAREPRDRGYR